MKILTFISVNSWCVLLIILEIAILMPKKDAAILNWEYFGPKICLTFEGNP